MVAQDACRGIDLGGSLADAERQMKGAGVMLTRSAEV
jgi:hypothetical protein